MSAAARFTHLRFAVLGTGMIFTFAFYPLTQLWPSGWSWGTGHSHYLPMILATYGILGLSLIFAARDPLAERGLIWSTIWSSVAHGAVMAFQATVDPAEVGHLFGDVPALLLVALTLAILLKRAELPAVTLEHQVRRAA